MWIKFCHIAAIVIIQWSTADALQNILSLISRRSKRQVEAPETYPTTQLPCQQMVGQPGQYSFRPAEGSDAVWGLFIIGSPDALIEITFNQFDISCDKEGFLSVVDGWEMHSQLFPSQVDHELDFTQRYRQYCGKMQPKKFRSRQNVAMLQYRVTNAGGGVQFEVNFIQNRKPCNAILLDYTGEYTLRNYGRAKNCSVSIITPQHIQIVTLKVGTDPIFGVLRQLGSGETGLITKCLKRGFNDYVELRTGNGWDPIFMSVLKEMCGLDSYSKDKGTNLGCDVSVVRLVSSGRYENSVTFKFNQITVEPFLQDLICTA